MRNELEINSFDDLKAALDKALHESGVPSETADYLMERFDVLCVDIDNVFLSVPVEDVQERYPNLSIDEAREVRDNAAESLRNSSGYDDIYDTVWNQINHSVWNQFQAEATSRGDKTHAENSLDELAETYGEKDASCEGHDLGDIEDIPR